MASVADRRRSMVKKEKKEGTEKRETGLHGSVPEHVILDSIRAIACRATTSMKGKTTSNRTVTRATFFLYRSISNLSASHVAITSTLSHLLDIYTRSAVRLVAAACLPVLDAAAYPKKTTRVTRVTLQTFYCREFFQRFERCRTDCLTPSHRFIPTRSRLCDFGEQFCCIITLKRVTPEYV